MQTCSAQMQTPFTSSCECGAGGSGRQAAVAAAREEQRGGGGDGASLPSLVPSCLPHASRPRCRPANKGPSLHLRFAPRPSPSLISFALQTPSADLELWAAIMASLEEQVRSLPLPGWTPKALVCWARAGLAQQSLSHALLCCSGATSTSALRWGMQGKAQHRRHLSRHLSDVSPEVAGQLRTQRSEAARVSPEGVTYFDLSSSSSGSNGSSGSKDGSNPGPGRTSFGSVNGGVTCSSGGGGGTASPLLATAPGDCGLILPSFEGYPAAVREVVLGQLCNAYLQGEAEAVRQGGGGPSPRGAHTCGKGRRGRCRGCSGHAAGHAPHWRLIPAHHCFLSTPALRPAPLLLPGRRASSMPCPGAPRCWCCPRWATATASATQARWASLGCTTETAACGERWWTSRGECVCLWALGTAVQPHSRVRRLPAAPDRLLLTTPSPDAAVLPGPPSTLPWRTQGQAPASGSGLSGSCRPVGYRRCGRPRPRPPLPASDRPSCVAPQPFLCSSPGGPWDAGH